MQETQPVTHRPKSCCPGEPGAVEFWTPTLYEDLRKLGRRCLTNERRDHSWQATELVHEAYLRLAGTDTIQWVDRDHVRNLSKRTMRRILCDYARKKRTVKRGRGERPVPLEQAREVPGVCDADARALREAFAVLARQAPRQAQVARLRHSEGRSVAEVATLLGVSEATVHLDWKKARWTLQRLLGQGGAR